MKFYIKVKVKIIFRIVYSTEWDKKLNYHIGLFEKYSQVFIKRIKKYRRITRLRIYIDKKVSYWIHRKVY